MSYIRGKQINDGGEGKIFEVQGRSDLLMKVYKEKNPQGKLIITQELQNKLEFMKNNPPASLISQGAIAWPLDLVYEQGQLNGFVMPKLTFDTSLSQIYDYKHPSIDKNYADFPSVRSRLGIAINLTSTLFELQRLGYVVGDLNHENIGVNRKMGQINIVDCDSFHIIDNNGNIMRTNVVMEGYLAPEIIAHCNSERTNKRPYSIDEVALPTFSKQSDLFCLAVHIFKSLMNGVSPFLGIKEKAVGSTAAPFVGHEGVERNNYVFKSGLRPSAVYCIASNEIPPEIASMFNRAFIDGHTVPGRRPPAEEWYNVLAAYMDILRQCSKNPKHQYYNKLSSCPYCEADKRHLDAQTGRVSSSQKPKTTTKPAAAPTYTPAYTYTPPYRPSKPKKRWKGVVAVAIAILAIGFIYVRNSNSKTKTTETATVKPPPPSKEILSDYAEGQELDADGNGKPDFVVKNGRLIGTVSGKDFGPASLANFNSRKITEQDRAREWKWRDENWPIDGQSASVIIFDSTIQNCTGFTFGLKIDTTDSTNNNFSNGDLGLSWPVYVWSGDGGSVSSENIVGDIRISQKDTWIYTDITFSSRNVYWILFKSPRRADGSWSGYSCRADISKIKT